MNIHLIVLLLLQGIVSATSQTGTIAGQVTLAGEPAPYATVSSSTSIIGDSLGRYRLTLPVGEQELAVSFLGAEDYSQVVAIKANREIQLDIDLKSATLLQDAVVVTGTKTFKRQTNSPVIVQVMTGEMLDGVQACNMSEGLSFQPGLRVESNCQTCNYTQLRMNGLAGGYSQILINGRPIFSPLTGLYGLEQIPTNMVERVEIVRGGGSSLYGSSAIAGTVNIITTTPTDDSWEVGHTLQAVGGAAIDTRTGLHLTRVSQDDKAGFSLFGNYRFRDYYDHNGDNFSELPILRNTSIGGTSFYTPEDRQKLEFSGSYINEYRFGGEMRRDIDAFRTQQAEERLHQVYTASLDYQLNSKDDDKSLITYAAVQHTDRGHYTGILPDDPEELAQHLAAPPTGRSSVTTLNAGIQGNVMLPAGASAQHVLTVGSEVVSDNVYDGIETYQYLIDQSTINLGTYVQSDWAFNDQLSLLTGLRLDYHNLVDGWITNPRLALLYKRGQSQFRLSYGTGFRAPQAFDTDLHISFAGGGVSRVQLDPDLASEQSRSVSLSANHDHVTDSYVAGFTLEGFYTRLNQAFVLQPIGQDDFGEVFLKQNSGGALVAGVTLELRANYDRKVQLESGITYQRSRFDEPVTYFSGLAERDFIRTPDLYGYGTLSITPKDRWSGNINYVYKGSMIVPHFAGSEVQLRDESIRTDGFHDIHLKLNYTLPLANDIMADLSLGCRNVFNSYQDDFDISKNRDSNYTYGPMLPRTWYVSFSLKR